MAMRQRTVDGAMDVHERKRRRSRRANGGITIPTFTLKDCGHCRKQYLADGRRTRYCGKICSRAAANGDAPPPERTVLNKRRHYCPDCGHVVRRQDNKIRFCSADCHRNEEKLYTSPHDGYELSTGSKGAVGELLVCADLLRRGYEVFRSESPAASCDLIALRGNRCLRIEVKTAILLNTGEYKCGWASEGDKHDHLAKYTVDGIIYEPPLDD